MSYTAQLNCPEMEWAGIKPSTLRPLEMSGRLIPLSSRDRKKIIMLLARKQVTKEMALELSKLIYVGYKAEIQILSLQELIYFLDAQ
jgi:hypothetical protein